MRGHLRVPASLDNLAVERLRQAGYSVVAGVDEVGRGALAGPVTAAAVVLPSGITLAGVRDSKKLSFNQRRRLARQIQRAAVCLGVGWSLPAEIDQHGLTEATRRAALRALAHLGPECRAVVLDGKHNYLPATYYCRTVVGGDDLVLSVAAASIVAKVARDNYMRQAHRVYPQYGFDTNVGYGTANHRLALQAGLSPLHRRLFVGE